MKKTFHASRNTHYAIRITFHHIMMRKCHIYLTLILLATACLWTRHATATETQQLYDKAVLYKEMYQTALEVGRDYCLSKKKGEAVSRYFPLYLGILSYEMGEWEKAIQNFKKFEEAPNLSSEDKALSQIRQGMALYRQEKRADAQSIWQRETRDNGNNPQILSAIGYAYARSDFQLDEALRLCQTSSQKAPNDPIVKRNLGWAYLKNGDLQKGRELLEATNFRVPDFVEKKGDREYAFYDAAILLHLSHLYFTLVSQATAPEAQLLAATASYELGEYKTAAERFQKLAEQNRPAEGVIAAIRLGACYYKLNQPDKARQIWDDLRKKNPKNKELLTELGRVYSSLKINLLEAERLCSQALPHPLEKPVQVQPKDYKYYRNLGGVYFNAGKYKEAIQALDRTRNRRAFNSVQKNGPLFFLQLANCYYRTKNFAEALKIYRALAAYDRACVQISEMVELIAFVERKQNPGTGISG